MHTPSPLLCAVTQGCWHPSVAFGLLCVWVSISGLRCAACLLAQTGTRACLDGLCRCRRGHAGCLCFLAVPVLRPSLVWPCEGRSGGQPFHGFDAVLPYKALPAGATCTPPRHQCTQAATQHIRRVLGCPLRFCPVCCGVGAGVHLWQQHSLQSEPWQEGSRVAAATAAAARTVCGSQWFCLTNTRTLGL